MQKLIEDYVFSASAKTVTSPDFSGLSTRNILLVVNVTDGIIIFNPIKAATTGSLSGGVLTLTYDTTSMSDGDQIQIYIDDGFDAARDDNLDTLVYFASAIHEKMPVCDTLDRVLANVVGSVTVSGNLSTVSTVTNITSMNSMQNQPTALAPYNWSSGAYHIYNGIEVT